MSFPLHEGKAKRLWVTADPNILRMEFKDDATAFDGKKKAQFENKGRLNNSISTLIYAMLEKEGVPTHFVRTIDETNIEVKKVEILKVEVIVRNIAVGSFSRRTGVPEGRPFKRPIIEFSYKSDELGDPLINDDYIREMDLATPDEVIGSRGTCSICSATRNGGISTSPPFPRRKSPVKSQATRFPTILLTSTKWSRSAPARSERSMISWHPHQLQPAICAR